MVVKKNYVYVEGVEVPPVKPGYNFGNPILPYLENQIDFRSSVRIVTGSF